MGEWFAIPWMRTLVLTEPGFLFLQQTQVISPDLSTSCLWNLLHVREFSTFSLVYIEYLHDTRCSEILKSASPGLWMCFEKEGITKCEDFVLYVLWWDVGLHTRQLIFNVVILSPYFSRWQCLDKPIQSDVNTAEPPGSDWHFCGAPHTACSANSRGSCHCVTCRDVCGVCGEDVGKSCELFIILCCYTSANDTKS